MTLSPDERTVYAANWSSNDVSAVDLATGSVRRYPTVRTPRGLFPTPDGKRLYVAGYEDGELQRIELASGAGTVLLRTGGAMRHLIGDPSGGRLYADDMAEGQTYVVDLATERVRPLARVDNNPNTINLSPDGRVPLRVQPRPQRIQLVPAGAGVGLGRQLLEPYERPGDVVVCRRVPGVAVWDCCRVS